MLKGCLEQEVNASDRVGGEGEGGRGRIKVKQEKKKRGTWRGEEVLNSE